MIAAVGTLVAIRKGANDIEGATRLAQNGLWLAWGLALFAALVLWNLEPVLLLFGQQPENVASAAQFLTLLPALPGYLTFMALRGFTSALGRSTPVMVISLVGTVLNYLLNVALIEGMFGLPRLGLMGIGLVTAVVSMGMAIALSLYIRWHPAYAAYPLRRACRAHRCTPCVSCGGWACRLAAPTWWKWACSPLPRCAWGAGQHRIGGPPDRPADRVHGIHGADRALHAVTMRVGLYYGAGNLLAARSAGAWASASGQP